MFCFNTVGDTLAETEKKKYIIPKRKGPICDGTHAKIIHDREHVKGTLTIEVNYLPLKITKPQLKIFHYDVKFAPNTPKILLR